MYLCYFLLPYANVILDIDGLVVDENGTVQVFQLQKVHPIVLVIVKTNCRDSFVVIAICDGNIPVDALRTI